MKKYAFLILILAVAKISLAQNTFPANGNVGIGTQSPQFALDVNGEGRIASSIITNSNSPFTNSSIMYSSAGMHNMFGVDGSWSTKFFGMKADGTFVTIGGKVGIGTQSPQFALDVNGEGRVASSVITDSNSPFVNSSILYSSAGMNNIFGVDGSWSTKFFGMKADGTFVAIGGNVGIGTTTPQEKLSVNGNIRAKEVKVETTNWPDYVFADDYKPTSLEELEKFIKANKHLPEMPTAKEAETNGVDLGNMNKLLLKKVEELTLLLIEQGKEISSLKQQISQKK